ncbi:bile acid:sodium symporter family protein [Tuwongella immobilis]|uniref:Bile acid:sodium symporter n=1 Tax=Tuwongella immobilis TaxID=692036 RepID=A0A6C2YLV3_9BACT|nr:bile acid:sodium symporter family protein [Tuwongella immobilis]VIP02560.1 Bile acid:sodium symporter OS=Opitutus terrae (strain DSM 11246 / PB90-1) GN=Oter_3818 PE=4 SV=1: DUF4137 [Tuwongella immobilis]VTS01769.1 Bile acid:sodium symporter OS=Opitutus terrae (strain DSM 11246 / PB90-1) GN=Oter_3818 PE=4 SV=1: DUF4137 [Tuwongella immobilis]
MAGKDGQNWLNRHIDWFLVGMLTAVLLAWRFPGPGASGGWMQPEILTKGGVALVFFLHGLGLPFAALKAGTLRWPLHLLIQSCTFLAFPLMAMGWIALVGERLPAGLSLGFFYLGALPSTVSSSVALTAAARGNVSVAVFNATISALLGVILTPLWLTVQTPHGQATLPLGPVVLDLTIWLVLPLTIGQLLRPVWGAWAARNKWLTSKIDRGTILLLVYTSFCESFQRDIWSEQGWEPMVLTVIGTVILLVGALTLTSVACRICGFDREDRIAAVFCGSKKTLASGVPMAALIFGTHAEMGQILLPIMLYHPIQLIVCGVLAGRWANRPQIPA